LAAKLGVKIAAGAKMLKAGLVERRRGVGGATCLVCVGGAGRPVLAAAHGIASGWRLAAISLSNSPRTRSSTRV
jgi:hypothetical protein